MSGPALSLEALRAMFSVGPPEEQEAEGARGETFFERPKTLPLGLRSVDGALPEGGLPRGAVVEIATPRGLGRSTSFALAACASAQRVARLRSGDRRTVGAWCAFVDPWSTLHAAGVIGAFVDPSRLLVVRPPLEALARVTVRIVSSRAFSVVVVDTASLPGVSEARGVDLDRWGTTVRRLALAVERADTTVLLLTDSLARRSTPLPVAMRIELERSLRGGGVRCAPASAAISSENFFSREAPPVDVLTLRVAKDRRGRVSGPTPISLDRRASPRNVFEERALEERDREGDLFDESLFDESLFDEIEPIGRAHAKANDA